MKKNLKQINNYLYEAVMTESENMKVKLIERAVNNLNPK
jgi:hypothetical protein